MPEPHSHHIHTHHFSSMSRSTHQTRDLKQRVITCINKLSDRDTYTIAITELESIAKSLSHHDSYSIYLNCIYYTDASQKSPVRKQCARLLGFMSELHGNELAPFVTKMLSNIIKRLRDSDSSVRSALINAVSSMVLHISKVPFSAFLKPLMEAISVEQEVHSQMGCSLCLAKAIDSCSDPGVVQLERCVMKLMKLLRNESFKGKAGLLTLVGSVVGKGGVSSRSLLGNLIPCLVEFLGSDDWASRKAAAEALERVAVVERDLVSEFKSSCLLSFESRRFDKVKAVRETMNQMLEAWKVVPDEISQPSQSKSSSKENASDGCFQRGSRNSGSPQTRKFRSPISRQTPPERSSATNVREKSPWKISESKSTPALFRKLDRKKPANWKVEIALPHTPPSQAVYEERDLVVTESRENEDDRHHKLGTRRALFNRNSDNKMHKFGGLKSGSRVVPVQSEECLESTVVASNNTECLHGYQKNSEDLSLIRRQLVQIENQQSSLLDLLQRFMGSSQNGMRSLETRVHGLEVALDEISYDLAVSTGRISNSESAGNTCCKLPGAEFLSSKFWRKTEGRYFTSRLSSSLSKPLRATMHDIADRDGIADSFRLETRRLRLQGGGALVVNPLADISSGPRESLDVNRLPKTAGHGSVGVVASPSMGV